MLKTLLVMIIAVTSATAGDLLLARGMKEVGDLSALNLSQAVTAAGRAVTTPKLICGTMLLAVFFFLWLAVLSWEDVSVALPMQALNFVVVAFCSQWILQEAVTPMRWGGTLLICLGVLMVTKSA